MSRGLYMDVHIPSAITDGLIRRGIDVLTAQADDAAELDDASLLQRAADVGRILFTQDEDLLAIAAEWQEQSREFAGVVYSHQLGPGIGDVIEHLELLSVCATDNEILDLIVYLPLK